MPVYYTNPQSRGQIAHWMLEETGEPYETKVVGYDELGDPAFRLVNPMGKIPVLVDGGHVVTECAAIVAYLAHRYPEKDLGPRPEEAADYFRWLFFTAGPVEQAVVSKAMGWTIDDPGRQRMLGFGDFERPLTVLAQHLSERDWVCGQRFTAADVYVGSQVDWGLQFGTFPPLPPFERYAERLRARPAYQRTKAINAALMDQAKA